ncbi:MAG: universal stress protein [Bacillota bacterium]
MFKKILVAVDGYAPSLGAAKEAVEMAGREGAEVVALQVTEEVPLLQAEKEAETAALKGAGLQPLTGEPLGLVAAFGRQRGVTVTTVKKSGPITGVILDVAKETKSDLIVVGDSGRKGLQKLYFGSVARAVSEHARCPVLIIKKDTVDITEMLSISAEAAAAPEDMPPTAALEPGVLRKKISFASGLLALYSVMYFGAALLTSAPYKNTAAIELFGLPLAIWAGWTAIIGGVVITRAFLIRLNQGEGGARG